MKILKYLVFFFVIGSAVAAPAQDYKFLSWDEITTLVGGIPMTSHDKIQGYKLYCSPKILSDVELQSFTAQINVPNIEGAGRIRTELAKLPLNEGDNWCALTGYNFDNAGDEQEGGLSNWLNVKMTAGRIQNVSVPAAANGYKLELE